MNKKVITISRTFGSGGREIGHKLAEILGVPFYDKKLIELAADESGISEDLLKNVDETAANSFIYSLSVFAYTNGLGNSGIADLPMNDRLFIAQSKIIKDAAEKGSCVIVGRCADYILRENPDCINIFVHANDAFRHNHAVKTYGIPDEKADEIIAKTDKKRASYYNYYTSNKWGRAADYHLSVDSSLIGIDNTVDIILKFTEMKH